MTGRALRRLLRPPASALIVPVDDARAAVEAYGNGRGRSEPGMPPHITTLWPFLPRLRRSDRRALDEIARAVEPFDFELSDVGRFPGVTYLRPRPAQPFVDLTNLVWQRWPSRPPYAGAFPDVVPHVTLAHEERPAATETLAALLPIKAKAAEIVVMVPSGAGWDVVYRRSLGASSR